LWQKSALVFKSQLYPLKINITLTFFTYSWAEVNIVYALKKAGKKVNFYPKIALRTERFDPARNSYFTAHFSNAGFKCSRPLRNCGNIKQLYGRGQGECWLDIAQTIGLNCSMTHSPGKIENNCPYFLMTFRTQKKKKIRYKWFSYSTGYYVSPPIDQYLKFKNHYSLLGCFLLLF
jgi:hypothetical protein